MNASYDVIIIGTGEVFVDNRYVSPDTQTDANARDFQPHIHYLVGGATSSELLPSIGAVNPALTAMANALRVGEQLLRRLGVVSAGAPPPPRTDRRPGP